jgi:hypothetical protein
VRSRLSIVISVLLLAVLYSPQSFAQKWGKISKEELSMTSPPEAPDADAVILFDKGEYSFDYIYPVTFTRHKRVKVLTKRGVESANVSIAFREGEKIEALEGQTVTRGGRKVKLDGRQVFTKKGRDWDEVVFTLPAVEEGCVFEYRYEIWSEFTYFLRPWHFQNDVFTRLSQVTLKLKPWFIYSYSFVNPGSADTKPRIEEGGVGNPEEKEYVWLFENVAPIRSEPYLACIDDYRTSVRFEQVRYRRLYSDNPDAVDTWKEVGQDVDSLLYRPILEDRYSIDERVPELIASASGVREMAERIYDFVCQSVEWNGRMRVFDPDRKVLQAAPTDLQATAVEKNLLLLHLLACAGIEALPVLISTRDYGRVLTTKPGLFHFNHLIAYVKLGGEDSFLDAVDRFCPFDVLPVDDQVEYGLLLDGEKSGLIQLPACKVTSKKLFVTSLKLREDGGFSCSTDISYEGYGNISARKQVMEEGQREFAEQEALSSLPAATIDAVTYAVLDSLDQPLQLTLSLSAPHYAQVVGEDLYVNPTLFSRVESNPFKSESRRFPVDFGYPVVRTEDTEFSIPPGFEVQELPANVQRTISGASFSKTFSVEGNLIKCHRQLERTRTVVPVEQYQALREFYQDIVSADQLLVLLSKKPEE